MCFHLSQEARVYDVEDDVAGIICQALHHGLLLEVVSAEYLQVPAAAVGHCVGRPGGAIAGMDKDVVVVSV